MIILSSTNINFGKLSRNDTITKRVSIYNTDSISVDILNISSSSIDFEVAPNTFSIPGYESRDFSIKCTGGSNPSGIITISHTSGLNKTIDVIATILEPIVNLNTVAYNYGQVGINDSIKFERQITNDSVDGSILNALISSTDTNFIIGQESLNINSGESANINVYFRPSTLGTKNGIINIETNDVTSSYTIGVSGESVTPTYSISTSDLVFGIHPTNHTKSLTFELSNTHASANLIVNSIEFPDDEFTVDASSIKIAPSQSHIFTVSFSPVTSEPLSNTAIISTNAGNIALNYSGTGEVVPVLKTNITTIDFDIYALNIDKDVNLQISNVGDVDLEITSIIFPVVSSTTFTVSETFPFVVPHNSSVTITVTVNSTTEVNFSDIVTINSNSFDAPTLLNVVGNAESPVALINDSELDFGTIPVAEERQLPFTISNSGNVDLNVSITDSPHFTVDNANFIVNTGLSKIVIVTFLLETIGEVNETITINTNDITSPTILISTSGTTSVAHLFRIIPEIVTENYLSLNVPRYVTMSIINRNLFPSVVDSMNFTVSSNATATYDITTTGLPITLASGESIDLIIEILASTVGTIDGQIKFDTRVGENLQYKTSITTKYIGEIFSPEIEVSTNTISYGSVIIGETKYESIAITNHSSGAELALDLSTNNRLFHFKGENSVDLPVVDSVIILPDVDLVLDSIVLVDNLTGIQYTLGDPNNTNEFSVNTVNGVLTVNSSLNGRTFKSTYDYKQTNVTLNIEKKSTVYIDIGFSPRKSIAESAIISIESNDIATPTEVINVDGIGLAAVTSLSQENELTVFNVKLGKTIAQRVVLKNTGTVKLFVTDIDISPPFFVAVTEFDLDPNETYNLKVIFDPTNDSIVNQTIIVYSNAPDFSINVTGQGQVPIANIPALIDMGNVGLNIENKLTVPIVNNGDADMSVNVDVASEYFKVYPSTFLVRKNNSYDIVVSFKPTEELSYSDNFKFLTDDPNNIEVIVPVIGNGVLKSIIQVADKIEFPRTNVRETSQMILSVTNVGSDPLQLTSLSVTDNAREFSVNFTPTSIAPEAYRQYTVKFVPVNDGNSTGTITIESNDIDNPTVEVLLKGSGFQPEGEWKSFDLQQLMPEPLISAANAVESFVQPVKTILTLIKTIFDLVKVLLKDSSSALQVVLEKVQTVITDYINDLGSTGIYMLPIYPRTNYFDPNIEAQSGFQKFIASIGGGSEAFKKKIVDSFDDIYDSRRPQFSDSSQVLAYIIAIDSGNFADVIEGVLSLRKIFSSLEWESDVQAPSKLEALTGDKSATLRWELPEFITFNLAGLFNEHKIVDLIYGFEIYRGDRQSQLITATEDNYSHENRTTKIYSKGDIINFATNQKVEPIAKVKITGETEDIKGAKGSGDITYSYFIKNFAVGWKPENQEAVRSIGFEYIDSGLENGRSYYYYVRTIMSDKDGSPASPLSNEATVTPKKIELSVEEEFLNRCSNFTCVKSRDLITEIKILNQPKVKMIERTGIVQQSGKRTEKDKIQTDAGKQQVNVFSFIINDETIDINQLRIRNLTRTSSRINDDSTLKIDTSKFYDPSTKLFEDKWFETGQVSSAEKNTYFSILDETKLVLGWDLIATRAPGKTIITISDVSNIGYQQNDHIVIEYYKNEYSAACKKSLKYFNEVTCANGTTKCDQNKNKRCAYHGGTACLNNGYTLKSKNRCIPNRLLFDATFCQDGTSGEGGNVKLSHKPFRNDPNTCISTDAVCAGYTPWDEQTVGTFPNWKSFTARALIKPVDEFIENLNQWVNRELDAVQKGSSTVEDFIDLLGAKIEALEEFIDRILKITDTLLSIFSANAGFHILEIELDSGGIERVKRLVQSAEGGPDSGSNGFTAGVVLLAGGSEISTIAQFLKLFF